MLTNNIDKLEVGTGQYTFLLNDDGGIIDDLIVYRIEPEKFLLVVNASRTEEDFAWLQKHVATDVKLENRSDGIRAASRSKDRESASFFRRLFGGGAELPARNQISRFRARRDIRSAIARPVTLAKTAWKFSFAAKRAPKVWNELLAKGRIVRHSTLRTRRARHVAPRNVLSAERLRSYRRNTIRSKPGSDFSST